MRSATTTPAARRFPLSRRGRVWLILAAVVIAAIALVEVEIIRPRVSVRWHAEISAASRAALERRYHLLNGEQDRDSPLTWRYSLAERSRDNILALINDPAVDDTGGDVDRDSLSVPWPDVRIAVRSLWSLVSLPFPFAATDDFRNPWALFQLQSGLLLLAGGVLLRAARAGQRSRRSMTIAALAFVGVAAYVVPISPSLVRMSDAPERAASRAAFEEYAGVHNVRFEAHLSYTILGRIYRFFGQTEDAPRQAQVTLAQLAAAWFILWGLVIATLERFSADVVRYLALAVLAPSALLYFGWREFGYLSLNVAAFPLIAHGLRTGSVRLEAGSLLIGLGAALHGWGLVSLAGAAMAALAAPAAFAARLGRAMRVIAWGTAAYCGWVAIYIIVLKLPIAVGHVESIPWRPWFVDSVFDGRRNVAIFTATGVRNLTMQMWIVGVPLLIVAASLWRRYTEEVRTALIYAVPSVVLTTLVWHTQGLREDMDVVFAIFPAFYALAWVCAHTPKHARIAAALLVTAHIAFWRTVLDAQVD